MSAKATAMRGHPAVSAKRTVTAAERAMPTAALRGERYGSRQKENRCDEK